MKHNMKKPKMKKPQTPQSFLRWRTEPIDRAEDAAYVFGYHLMEHCRNEALKRVEGNLPKSRKEFHEQVAKAVDVALHNVVDLLEGFWPTQAGPKHRVSYALSVCVSDMKHKPIERIDISPCLLDLPIGYWKWKDGEFR